jgi:hypothetical protein
MIMKVKKNSKTMLHNKKWVENEKNRKFKVS